MPTRVGILERGRSHWHMENTSHWVRDVPCDEDRSQVRSRNIPQLMAALRNTAIGLLREVGSPNIAKAGRHMAAQPAKALALIGIECENCIALMVRREDERRRDQEQTRPFAKTRPMRAHLRTEMAGKSRVSVREDERPENRGEYYERAI